MPLNPRGCKFRRRLPTATSRQVLVVGPPAAWQSLDPAAPRPSRPRVDHPHAAAKQHVGPILRGHSQRGSEKRGVFRGAPKGGVANTPAHLPLISVRAHNQPLSPSPSSSPSFSPRTRTRTHTHTHVRMFHPDIAWHMPLAPRSKSTSVRCFRTCLNRNTFARSSPAVHARPRSFPRYAEVEPYLAPEFRALQS